MPLFNAEEWAKARKERRTKENLRKRQNKLLQEYRKGSFKFRQNPKLQLELRRVAALCTKLGEPLKSVLHDEIIRDVMES
jgi:hypothetical protein